jgi:hypothetical protein
MKEIAREPLQQEDIEALQHILSDALGWACICAGIFAGTLITIMFVEDVTPGCFFIAVVLTGGIATVVLYALLKLLFLVIPLKIAEKMGEITIYKTTITAKEETEEKQDNFDGGEPYCYYKYVLFFENNTCFQVENYEQYKIFKENEPVFIRKYKNKILRIEKYSPFKKGFLDNNDPL